MGGGFRCQREWGEFLMAEYITTDTELKTVADAIRGKTGGSANLSYPDGFASAIQGIGSFGADGASASDIKSGKKAYVGTSPVTGTMPVVGATNWDAWGTDRQIIAGNSCTSGAQVINAVTAQNLAAANVKNGVTIAVKSGTNTITSVTGTLQEAYTSMPRSSSCYCPFMFNTADTRDVRFYWDGSGFRVSAADSGSKSFIVPCRIQMAFYAESTSGSLSYVTFEPGYVYTLARVNDSAATITGTGVSTSVYKVYSWTKV